MSQVVSSGGGSRGGNDGNKEGRPSGGQREAAGLLGRSALISDLVAQLKRGDITKTELFSRLQQFQGPVSAMASATAGSSAGISASSTDGGGAAPSLRAGNTIEGGGGHQAFTGSPVATALSGESSAGAAGVAAGGPAGFFSAYDRQAIIQKIADERRRRAEEARHSWLPAEGNPDSGRRRSSSGAPLSSSSVELSASAIQSDSIAVESSAGSEYPQQTQERKEQGHLSSARGGSQSKIHSDGDDNKASSAVPRYSRKTAWEQEQEQEQGLTAAENPPISSHDASADEFPFPDAQDPRLNKSDSSVDDRGGLKARNVSTTVGEGAHTKGSALMPSADGSAAILTSSTSTDRSDAVIARGAANENGSLSRDGSNSKSNNQDRMEHILSRRRGSGGSSGSGPVGRSSSSGWSSYAKRASGVAGWDPAKGGGIGRYGADGYHHAGSGRASPSTSCHYRSHEQNIDNNFDRAPLGESPVSRRESSTHGRAGHKGGEGERRASYREGGGAFAKQPQDGSVTTAQSQQPEFGTAGQGEWMESVGDGEGARLEPAGQQQANERMVDEDAYRFRSFSEERARRGEELVRRELMSECTFKPKIKGLPQSYGATNHDDTPFLQRVNQWQREKEKEADVRKADGKDKELEECTFKPRVNNVSRRAARNRRQALGENHLTVDDRLFDESIRRDMDRTHLAAEQAAKEEERLHLECTFRPDLPTKNAADALAAAAAAEGDGEPNNIDWGYTVPRGRSRYREAAEAVAAAAAATGRSGGSGVWGAGRRANGTKGNGRGDRARHWQLESCTFTPNVIGARKGMDQAQQYLQYDVVERLTGAAFRPPDDAEDNGEGEGSEEGEELFREGGGTLRASQRQGFDVPSSTWGGDDGGQEPSPRRQRGEARSDTSSSFHAFLSRQNKMGTDKLKHIEQIQAMQRHPFQPEICAESTKIHMESNKGDFLQRVARDAARKEHEVIRQKATGLHDPDCTFKPQITARSANLQARSVVELSRGDQLKRETTQRLTRLRAEQELLADTTFRPRINADAASRMAVSKLKVVSDPDNYIATVESLRRRKEESTVRGAVEKAAKEVEGCTFRPETTECPAYITRIAQSISASKALPGGGKKKLRVKPDWR